MQGHALIIESSTSKASYGFWSNGSFQFIESVPENARRFDPILCVSEFFKKHHRHIGDLDYLVVSQGPGSYTPLRMGLACAQGLAVVHDIPIVAYQSTYVFAQAFCLKNQQYSGQLGVFLDARSQMATGQRFQVTNGQLGVIDEDPVCVSPRELLKQWDSSVMLVGQGVKGYQDLIEEFGLCSTEVEADAQALLSLWLTVPGKTISALSLQPIYVRSPV